MKMSDRERHFTAENAENAEERQRSFFSALSAFSAVNPPLLPQDPTCP
jgi:hypothetical protein